MNDTEEMSDTEEVHETFRMALHYLSKSPGFEQSDVALAWCAALTTLLRERCGVTEDEMLKAITIGTFDRAQNLRGEPMLPDDD